MVSKLNENAIREAAYYLWQNAGCPQGNDEYFWAQAVEQFSSKSKKTSACKSSSSCAASKKTASKSSAKKSK